MNTKTDDKLRGRISRVVIAGGGTAGWIAAAALSKKLGELLDITLVESEQIGTVGVGEATIPPLRTFHRLLGIDEQDFMRATQATAKLGIAFENWGRQGDRYIHSFGRIGTSAWLCDFHHFWLRGREMGFDAELGDFCLELQAAEAGKFATSPKSEINFAYHLDAGRYAKFLRCFSEGLGVRRVEGKIREVRKNAESGFIESLLLEDGQVVEGDLFIDCTGFRGLLIEQTLKTGYEDWSHWLPCDSAVPVQTEAKGPALPYTRSIARESGWQWRIPLQQRVGNGLVYCSRYLSDDEATAQLLENIDGEAITEPRVIRFKTGRRRKVWNKNCVALGLASGFLEPLESTSIHLIVTGATRLMQLFPFDGITRSLVDEYNELSQDELEKIRDFIVLHYHVTQREDSPFWHYCKNMQIPESLDHRIRLFQERAHAFQADSELFRVDSWVQVMLGQGLMPEGYHPLPRLMTKEEMRRLQQSISSTIARAVSSLPDHQDFIDHYCKSNGREEL
ncbi:tryptophan halogenase family protein [Microbulbifer rhizosphaerae]|uniref:Tryptophan halogenase n=1 Tax=Microbulbifer rhizosphaerae TaxID=1562603 RepID=A0A7W4WDZ9_9GAMM|nr:tryptophan halogenase family protein [Microbulbifer rhizosphaerae]MBB3062494.1 tryptophan halogenase [Microbulbifer rhizosphaerae]